jgi:glycosyltransferase involved in cell wall biosynthesis
MKITHLTTVHNATDTRIFDKEAKSVSAEGHKVTIISHDPPATEYEGVRFHSIGNYSSRAERWLNIPKAISQAENLDTDIYHIHDPELILGGLYLKYNTDAAVVYDAHEDFNHVLQSRAWIPEIAKPLVRQGVSLVQNTTVGRFDALVAAHKYSAEPLRQAEYDPIILNNFPKVSTLPDEIKTIERSARYVLIYTGGLSSVRGIHQMLRVLNNLLQRGHDIELWCLGKWTVKEDKSKAMSYITENKLSDRIKFPGYLDYNEMFAWLESADIGLAFLNTDHYSRGVPTKLFEYLYAGLPIVTTPVNAVSDYLSKKYYISVQEENITSMSNGVEKLIDRKVNTEEMKHEIKNNYSWESEKQKLLDLYQDIL